MPVICMPLRSPDNEGFIGIIQVINPKGIGNNYHSSDSKINPVDQEMLNLYS